MVARIRAMADLIAHRGPDDGQHWVDAAAGVALGFRRLAIVDLSPAGRQPMVSANGRFVMVYNGEVYNADDLRPALAVGGIAFRGHSDTEVILESCAAYGVTATVERLIGMFAIALYDRETRTLTLARDRLGIKPLYYGRAGDTILFGSQPKTFRPHPAFQGSIDRSALAAYLRFGYVPGPQSIYQELQQVKPGSIVEIDPAGRMRETCFWSVLAVGAEGRAHRCTLDDAAAIDHLDGLLRDAVRRRMVADVPLGAFLSGGIDSSTVVALMQAESTRPVETFSIGFREAGFDEAPHAAAVARHLGTSHHTHYVEPAEALAVIADLPRWYDEPFADSSQIPTYLVSALARRHVTVALSGDGGDELFAGYTRYLQGRRLMAAIEAMPGGLRAFLARGLRAVPAASWDGVAAAIPTRFRPKRAGDRAHKLADLLRHGGGERLYRQLVGQWPDPALLLPGVVETVDPIWEGALAASIADPVERMQMVDLLTYLPSDILTKVDRASMAVGLEARVPLLDHRVVAFALSLPMAMKIRRGDSKWLLRQVLARYVPNDLVNRPKMGFGVPIDRWLRHDLRDWAESLLETHALEDEGFDPTPIRALWAAHLSGTVNGQYPLWCVLMYRAWRLHLPVVDAIA